MALHAQLDEIVQRVLPVVQHFHARGMFSPHAATFSNADELAGHALSSDGSVQLSVMKTIEHFENQFARQAKSGELRATGIFYCSPGIDASAGGQAIQYAAGKLIEKPARIFLLEPPRPATNPWWRLW